MILNQDQHHIDLNFKPNPRLETISFAMKKSIHLMTKQVFLVYQTAWNTSYKCVYNPQAKPKQKKL